MAPIRVTAFLLRYRAWSVRKNDSLVVLVDDTRRVVIVFTDVREKEVNNATGQVREAEDRLLRSFRRISEYDEQKVRRVLGQWRRYTAPVPIVRKVLYAVDEGVEVSDDKHVAGALL